MISTSDAVMVFVTTPDIDVARRLAGAVLSARLAACANLLPASRYGDATFALGGFTITNGINSYTAIGQDALGRSDTNTVTVNIPSSVSYQYDLNGNLLWDGLQSYDYDDENQLIRVTTGSAAKSEFVYDGCSRRRIARDFVWGSVGGATNSMVAGVVLSNTVRTNLTGWAGLRFTVGGLPMVVTALGRWVVSGNSGSHSLKLVRSDGNDVPGANATVNLSGISTNQFSYASLSTPVVLEANMTYFLLSQEVAGGDKWYDYNSTLTPMSGFTINGTAWLTNNSSTYIVSPSTNFGYIPVNLKFTSGGWNLASETRYIYDGMTEIQERDQNNVPTVTYTRGKDLSGRLQGAGGIGGLLARTDHTATLPTHAFYHADGNGNITAMVNAQQALVARYIYDPFGNIVSKSGPLADVNAYRFSSKQVHGRSGLYYYGYRYYSPSLQRWISRDPIEERGGINLGTFAANSPINKGDANGHLVGYFILGAVAICTAAGVYFLKKEADSADAVNDARNRDIENASRLSGGPGAGNSDFAQTFGDTRLFVNDVASTMPNTFFTGMMATPDESGEFGVGTQIASLINSGLIVISDPPDLLPPVVNPMPVMPWMGPR